MGNISETNRLLQTYGKCGRRPGVGEGREGTCKTRYWVHRLTLAANKLENMLQRVYHLNG